MTTDKSIECDSCSKPANPDLLNMVDPFVYEIYPEDVTDSDYQNWCDDCYELRMEEI